MRAGDLDRLIEIQQCTTTVNEFRTPVETWSPFATMRAKLMQISVSDTENASRGNTSDAVLVFRTRWLDGLTLEHRVAYQGATYTIRNLKELSRRVGWDIRCERVGP
ncbi:phage head closure protein [Bradyrhizobium sp. WSM 1704]|uniref:phage head closure protein n=1 Tax=Bradyrhizobium semiaridum TaxID=2821404 RepID=UPI001CE294F4|nr:phage head closure protein [Bradyrhizobium semiaridum]MCA6124564.1 phage head closure protein [Bradyrhizobium semiaridum]